MYELTNELLNLSEQGFTLTEALIFTMVMEHHNPELDETLALQIMDSIRKHVENRKHNEK